MKKTTPFKALKEFEEEIKAFANIHHVHFKEHAKRVSDYFEMSCYNMIVHYYENLGYKMEAKNLTNGDFKYKCSPSGLLQNFSYFKGTKNIDTREDVIYVFHNATVQSSHDVKVFTTPDIVVSRIEEPKITCDYYTTKRRLSYIDQPNIITFCESKHLIPFPELMITFIGTVNELKPECLSNNGEPDDACHIAPSLMMSGTLSKPCKRIKDSLERRYYVNFFSDLFDDPISTTFSIIGMESITTLDGKKDIPIENNTDKNTMTQGECTVPLDRDS